MKKTKIIATVGPNSSDINVLKNMIINGCDVVRINLSHADIKFCKDIIKKVRKIEDQLNKPIGIMYDTTGPCVRLNEVENNKLLLESNYEIKIYNDESICTVESLSFNNSYCVNQLELGDILLLSDGKIELEVIEKELNYVNCKINKGGEIYSRQTVHLFNRSFNLPFIDKDDREKILHGIKEHVDFLAVSNVRTEEDINEIIDLLIENKDNHMQVIAKIECCKALENLDEIAKISDGLMVARGDLGIEMSLEKLPAYQKQIIQKAKEYDKLSIVATDLLKSMNENDYPSRSEVTDVYNSVIDSCDALLLSNETTVGNFPIESIETLNKIIVSAEEEFEYDKTLEDLADIGTNNITSNIAYSVVNSSLKLNASTIIANTNSGYTARLISKYRPKSPIVGLSPSLETCRSLTLVYGVIPRIVNELKTTDAIINMSIKYTTKLLELEEGNIVIITGGFPSSNKNTNFMKIEIIGD